MMRGKHGVKMTGILSTIFVCLCMALPFAVSGGSLEPSAPPGSTMRTLDQVLSCPGDPANKTNLLFPFVTTVSGFDTGIAISNTSSDPFGTTHYSGTCTLHFYGSGAPADMTTPSIAAGATYTDTAANISPGFQGYMIAVCNFPYAHGFAMISDWGATKIAAAYLPLVLCTNRSQVERLLP